MNREELIKEILDIEWQMFHNVPNVGGKAACQEDAETLKLMRASQGMSWSEATLASYLEDLKEAQKQGRNLLTEKYAHMMKSTSPADYDQIKHLLPPLNPEIFPLIDKIVAVMIPWQEQLAERFPYVLGQGRPIHASEDTPQMPSFETYLRGELMTFSKNTLKLYYENTLKQQETGVNGNEIVLNYTVKQYGYPSLEAANERMKNRQR